MANRFLLLLRILTIFILSTGFINQAVHASSCPTLPNTSANFTFGQWQQIHSQLQPLQAQCLRNSRYYSVLGAAQLNLQLNEQALLSLERALLLDETNGEAIVDYTQALFNSGQLFAALELNEQLLQRTDIPTSLKTFLHQRDSTWQQLTRVRFSEISWNTGYNSNLNNAPDLELLDVTVNGQAGVLVLDEKSKAISGTQQRLQFKHFYQKNTAESTQQLVLSFEDRLSRDTPSNHLRASVLYQYSFLADTHITTLSGSYDHNNFGGKALYSDSELSTRYTLLGNTCQPSVQATINYRRFHQHESADAALFQLNAGVLCNLEAGLLNLSFTHTLNHELQQRAGGNRQHWALQAQWQQPLSDGQFSSLLKLERSKDNKGYSDLLQNNAVRVVDQVSAVFDYSQAINENWAANATLSYNQYNSNLALFSMNGHKLEFGLRYRF